jgi:hypothetical protein
VGHAALQVGVAGDGLGQRGSSPLRRKGFQRLIKDFPFNVE